MKLSWSFEPIDLELKFVWKISRGSVSHKTNYIIRVTDGEVEAMGEIAGITERDGSQKLILDQFKKIDLASLQTIEDIQALRSHSSLKFGLESALVHLLAKKNSVTVSQFLKTKANVKVESSISLPMMEISEIGEFIQKYNFNRFKSCKVKVGGRGSEEICREVVKHFRGPLRIDANEAFQSSKEVLSFINNISDIEVEFLEQPMPSSFVDEYKKLKPKSAVPLVADESIHECVIDQLLCDQFHGVNIKVMKSGGYYRAIEQIRNAKNLGLKVMQGCMLETSLAISSALHISEDVDWIDLDGFLVLKQDPFDLVSEKSGYISLN